MSLSPNVFEYFDYRRFLQDYYDAQKARERGFSYRFFARRAGFRAPNYVKLIIAGARRLTPSATPRVTRACHLDKDSAEYFAALVRFTDAPSSTEREAQYDVLRSFRGYQAVHRVDEQHAAYFRHWYVPAIHELALRGDFQATGEWTRKQLVPTISKREAERALKVLFSLGLFQVEDGGVTRRPHPAVSTGAEAKGVHVASYHRAMLERAACSIDLFPASDRDISSVTLCLDANELSELKRRISRFRQDMLAWASKQENPRQVVQVNIQMFPMSKEDSNENKTTKPIL